MNTRKNSIRNWLRKCGILTLTAGMILTGMITKPVQSITEQLKKNNAMKMQSYKGKAVKPL